MIEPDVARRSTSRRSWNTSIGVRSFDFTGYKRSSLMRRVNKRMQMVGVEGFAPYLDYLEVHPEEFRSLFDTILINVTGFFRDPTTWEAIASEIIPRMLAAKRPEEPIRIWSAGCASGEEAYSLAIALAEALGPGRLPRPGEDLRHRRRRRGPVQGPPGPVRPQGRPGHLAPPAGQVFRADQPIPSGVPQGSPPLRDLRPPRPDPGRPDLADRPA